MSDESNRPEDKYGIRIRANSMSDAVMEDVVRMIQWVKQLEASVCPECGTKYGQGLARKNNRLVCQCGWEGPSE